MANLNLKNVKVWTPNGFEIQSIQTSIPSLDSDLTYEGEHFYWVPPLVELFADFKEPGLEHVYSFESGQKAMIQGGFGTVLLDPNSQPVSDQEEVIEWILNRVDSSPLDIKATGAMTKGQKGEELSEMSSMIKAGVTAFSNGVRKLPKTAILRSIFEYSSQFSSRLFILPWEDELCGKGLVNEDDYSSVLGLSGWPMAAERLSIIKCLELAKLTGAKIHLRQLTLVDSVELVFKYREEGVDCTFDVNPAHLFRSNSEILNLDVNDKIIPPLRPENERSQLNDYFLEGHISCLSSQHRPVLPEFKEEAFGDAKPGNISLETTLAELYAKSDNDELFHKLFTAHSQGPAKLLGSSEGFVLKSSEAGVLFDSSVIQQVEKGFFAGNVRNSKLMGKSLKGKISGFLLNNSWITPI